MPESGFQFEICPPWIRSDGSSEQITHRHSCRMSFMGAVEPGMLLHCEHVFDVHWLKLANYKRHRMDTLGIEYVREGSLRVWENGREYRVMPGEILLMLPEGEIEVRTGPEEYCIKSSLLLDGDLLPEIIRQSGLAENVLLRNIDRNRFERMLEAFRQLSQETARVIRQRCGVLCYEMLEFLLAPHPEPGLSAAMARVENYIRKHTGDALHVPDLARVGGCSEGHLNRLFRAEFGMTPYQYWQSRRLRHAADLLLRSPELSIKEVAMETGFANALNFSTAFRKSFGASPREYRRRLLPE